MKVPLRISTRKISLSASAMKTIQLKADKLERFYNKIIACRVMVETPHRHKNHGQRFNVSIDISVPGAELAVKRESNEDIYVAIRDAFEAARRQLLNHNRKRQVKPNKSLRENRFDVLIMDDTEQGVEDEEDFVQGQAAYTLDYV